ncbi:MAG: methylmalonyl-CoA mutase [Chlorobiaceae bacterium]|nr:methylmalonyl-CoA mutase [Chlorobiaceae bacterium]
MTNSLPDSLFQEFPAVSRAEWKTKATSELKETPYEKIVWKTPDGFELEPWCSREEHDSFLQVPAGKHANSWTNCRVITVTDPSAANCAALKSFASDVSAIEFHITAPHLASPENLSILLSGIEASALPVYFSGNLPPAADMLAALSSLPGFRGNEGGLLSPLPFVSREADLAYGERLETLPGFRLFAVDTISYNEHGSTPALEIALALAGVSETLNRFTKAGLSADRIISATEIILPVGTSHFSELAKPRALRYLLGHLLKAYGANPASLPRLFAKTSRRTISLLDPYTNILRLTTEAVSAILGGYETLQIGAFDNGLSVENDIAERITGNIHLVLQSEATLQRVVDPASGSNYIETLTRKLAVSAWESFRKIEAAGGLKAAEESGMIRSMLAASAAREKKEIGSRKKTLIGVNRYPWPLTPEQDGNMGPIETALEAGLEKSASASYELLRLKTLTHAKKNGRLPSVFIWTIGDPAISFRQAAFCEDFFKCGGFHIEGMASLPVEEKSYAAVQQRKPDIVVLCIAEKDTVPAAEQICISLRQLQPAILKVMAGKPPFGHEKLLEAGLDSFIYTGVNVLDMLETYQRKTGVQ